MSSEGDNIHSNRCADDPGVSKDLFLEDRPKTKPSRSATSREPWIIGQRSWAIDPVDNQPCRTEEHVKKDKVNHEADHVVSQLRSQVMRTR